MTKSKNQKEELMNNVTEAKGNLPAEMDMNSWGPSPINSKDIIIPRILLMQPGSELVTEGEAAFGEIIDSLTGKKLGDMKKPIMVIPFAMKKAFVEYEAPAKKGDKKKFLRVFPVTPENEDLPYEDEGKNAEGKTIKISRDFTMNFYVLLPEEVSRGGELPYILTFRRTGLKNGKKLATQMYVTNAGSNLPPPGLLVTVAVKKESNDLGTWCTPDVLLGTEFTKIASQDQMRTALKWFKVISSGGAKDHDEVLAKEDVAVSEEVTNGPAQF